MMMLLDERENPESGFVEAGNTLKWLAWCFTGFKLAELAVQYDLENTSATFSSGETNSV